MGVFLSNNFIYNLKDVYYFARDKELKNILSNKVLRRGINFYTDFGHISSIIAVAAIESFLNEIFICLLGKYNIEKTTFFSKLTNEQIEKIEKLNLSLKLILIPELLIGKTLEKDKKPYQNSALLIKIRNSFVHYKLDSAPPKGIKELWDKNIALQMAEKSSKNYLDMNKANWQSSLKQKTQ